MFLSKRNKVLSVAGVTLCLSFFFFLNTKSLLLTHEVPYNPAKAIPLSSLISGMAQKFPTVEILPGEVVYIDKSLNLKKLIINGELHCDDRAPETVELKVETIYVNGVFQCGKQSNRYNKNLIISLKHNATMDARTNPAYRALLVNSGGKLIMNGRTGRSGWYKLGRTAEPGDTSIELALSLSKKGARDWRIGDTIAIGPTSYNYAEAENFVITGFSKTNPNLIYLDRPLTYRHWGEVEELESQSMGTVVLDERAEVANLTRSIVIRADESTQMISEADTPEAQLGGHVMVNRHGFAAIDSVEFYRMGQAGIMARYPFHWHLVGDAPGQFIKNSSVHRSFQRCITVHRTNKTVVQNNVCYDFKGHGYFFEDGTETDNIMNFNLGIMAKAPSPSKILLASDDVINGEKSGRFPSVSVFWISNPDNTIEGNVASGSVGTGFWMAFEKEVKNLQGTQVEARPLTTNTKKFNNNTAHAAKVGMTWDGAPDGALTDNPNNPQDRLLVQAHYAPPNIPIFNNLKAYKNLLTGIYFRSNTTILNNLVVADNGWALWNGYNQIVKNSVIIGETQNKSSEIEYYFFNQGNNQRRRRAGVVIYDGPFEVHNTDFLNYSTEPQSYTLANGQQVDSTYIPFTAIGGTRKYINYTSGLSFFPEPVYRAFIPSPNTYGSHRSHLGISMIRDLDGSLAGTSGGRFIVGNRSTGTLASDNCQSGETSLFNFSVCPAAVTQGMFTFMRWNGPASAWKTPFVVIRNDDVLNYPPNEWSVLHNLENNNFSLVNSTSYEYEMMPKYDYVTDKSQNVHPRFRINTERADALVPVVKIRAYGNNCSIDNGAIAAKSLAALKSSPVSAYYSKGEEFYVKLIANEFFNVVIPNEHGVAQTYDTSGSFLVTCDNTAIPNRVIGQVESFVHSKQTNNVTIKGWACDYKNPNSIAVKLYAVPPVGNITRSVASKKISPQPIQIAQGYSNRTSEARLAFKCGAMTNVGRRFEFVVPKSTLDSFLNDGYQIKVKGFSNTGGAAVYLPNVATLNESVRITK